MFIAKVFAREHGLTKEQRALFLELVEQAAIERDLIRNRPAPDAAEATLRVQNAARQAGRNFSARNAMGPSMTSYFTPRHVEQWLQRDKLLTLFNRSMDSVMLRWAQAQNVQHRKISEMKRTMRHDPVTGTLY